MSASSSFHTPHICFVAHGYQAEFKQPEDLLDAYYSLTEWSEALVEAGCQVSAVVRFHYDATVQRNGVHYHFTSDSYGPQLAFWQVPRKMHQKVIQVQADIVHAHNLNKILVHRDLLKQLSPNKTPLILQNHAEQPSWWIREQFQRAIFPEVEAFLFCAPKQEDVWLNRKIIPPKAKLYHVMEAATYFSPKDRLAQQKQTGLKGNPIFLWVGHLDENKDPLTIIKAFKEILRHAPQAQLYLIYRTAPLLQSVLEAIDQNNLSEHVHLLGARTHAELESYFNSAHYFILGSHREGSGYSAMEAIACGCVPILTNIPSYRMMTNQGSIGALWEVGQATSLQEATIQVLQKTWNSESERARAYFEQQLSYPAIVKKMMEIYEHL